MKIFLSYASEDRRDAESIYYKLVNADHTIFFDRRSLSPGKEFDSEIKREINESDLFIFLISPNSVDASSYTLTELKFAEEKWKHPKNGVLPVMLTATDYNNIPGYLSAVTFFEAHGNMAAEVAAHIEKLIDKKGKPKYKKQIIIGIIALLMLIALGIKYFANNDDISVALQNCQNPNSSQDIKSVPSSNLSIFKASGNGREPRVKECLELGMDVNSKDHNDWTALHAASWNGETGIVELLLKQDQINIDARSNHMRTPLSFAVEKTQYETVEALLKKGANQYIAEKNIDEENINEETLARRDRLVTRTKETRMINLLEKYKKSMSN